MARIVTLAKSVLRVVPSYFMQTLLIPIGVVNEIKKVVRKSIWGLPMVNGSQLLLSGIPAVNRLKKVVWVASITLQVVWRSMVKTNVDGAIHMMNSWSSMGRVIREAKGKWIVGFRKATGVGKIINAKLWAVFTGLELAWSKGFKKVEVKSDNMQVVRLNNNRGLAAIVTEYGNFASRNDK
ncbi:hypothetical protein Gotur_020781 [Gossypium turneri]